MIRTYAALNAVDPGFTDPEHLQAFGISIPEALEPDFKSVHRDAAADPGAAGGDPRCRLRRICLDAPAGRLRAVLALLLEDKTPARGVDGAALGSFGSRRRDSSRRSARR